MTTVSSVATAPPMAPPIGDSPQADWSPLLKQLLDNQSLSIEQSAELMEGWIAGTVPPALSGAILGVLQAKGISANELTGMAQVLRKLVLPCRPSSVLDPALNPALNPPKAALDSPILDTPIIDTCGTGGDGASTFNISTAVAFVVAAAGVKVAKHGNRSASSKAGSADVLEALGVNLSADRDRAIAALEAVGITFLFAPNWHPAFKAVGPLRTTLKIRTIFNLLGPLLNPMQPTGQVIGVSSPELVETMATALSRLGTKRAIVVYGREQLDEAGLADYSNLATVKGQEILITAVNPQMLGLNPAPTEAIKGGDVHTNADILKAVLQGKGTRAQQQVVALNAALALKVGEALPLLLSSVDNSPLESEIDELKQGIAIAQEVLASGEAWRKLEQLSQFLQ
jgi:anthranilate phosphoribosyltransferase